MNDRNRTPLRGVSAALLTLALTSGAQAQVAFTDDGTRYPFSLNGLQRADLDGDGRADLVFVGTANTELRLRARAFAGPGVILDGLIGDVVIADFDGDGTSDLLGRQRATDEDPARVGLWLNRLPGFQPVPDQVDGPLLRFAVAADFDLDGDVDVIGATGPAIGMLRNDGIGNLTWGGPLFNETIDGLAAGDVDADGDADLVAAVRTGWRLWINQGQQQGGAAGTFSTDGIVRGSGVAVRTPIMADVDGDGDRDLYIASAPLGGSHADRLWINQGGRTGGDLGEFQPAAQAFPDQGTRSADFFDADGDGDPDLVLALDDGVELLLNAAGEGAAPGTFRTAAVLASPFVYFRALILPREALPNADYRVATCCDGDGGGLWSSLRRAPGPGGLPDLEFDGLASGRINLGMARELGCGAARRTSRLRLRDTSGAPRTLDVSLTGPPAITSNVLGRLSFERAANIELACDALAAAGPGRKRATLTLADPGSGVTREIPVECFVSDTCPFGACLCENTLAEGCCAYICGVFAFQGSLFGLDLREKSLDPALSATTLRAFRDGPMSADPVWNYYRMRFEVMTSALIDAAAEDLGFLQGLAAIQSPWVLALDAVTRGEGETAIVTDDMERSLNHVLDHFERYGKPVLADEIARERSRLGLDDIAGMDLRTFFERMATRGAELGDIRFRAGFE